MVVTRNKEQGFIVKSNIENCDTYRGGIGSNDIDSGHSSDEDGIDSE